MVELLDDFDNPVKYTVLYHGSLSKEGCIVIYFVFLATNKVMVTLLDGCIYIASI